MVAQMQQMVRAEGIEWEKATTVEKAKTYIRLRIAEMNTCQRLFDDPEPAAPRSDDDMMSISEPEPNTAAGSGTIAPDVAPQLRRAEEESEQDFKMRVVLQQTAYRWREESITRAELDQGLPWTSYIPNTREHRREQTVLYATCDEYVKNWDSQLCMKLPRTKWPRSLRVLTVEMIWCLEQMHAAGVVPRHLWWPLDRAIRAEASEAALGQEDPGNLVWEDVATILRLSRYVCPTKRRNILRVTPTDYGVATNMSAKGTINLRGNVIEALCNDFQARASAEDANHDPTRRRWRDRT